MTRRTFLGSAAVAAAGPARCAMGLSPDCFVVAGGRKPALEYLEYARTRGAGGVQAALPPDATPELLRTLRQRSEQLGMYLEVTLELPTGDGSRFEATARAAKEAGAVCLRSVCLSGRRYENFTTLAQWQAFVETSRRRLDAAVKILERLRLPLGLENHKDWTVEEMVPLLRGYSSEFLGACIDWGNNLSLLDDPLATAEALAPFAVNAHIKDMAVEEYDGGFRMSEVPLGHGFLPLRQILDAIRKVRPQVRYSLDMLTRNPLVIPCLTEKYWTTMSARNGVYLARTLQLVRTNRPAKPLIRLDGMSRDEQLQLEQDNVRRSVEYARDVLGLRH